MTTTMQDQKTGLATFNPNQAITFSVDETAIAKVRDQFMSLKINGVKDTKGYEAVHAARMQMVRFRTTVEKQRKDYKAAALEYGRSVDGAAKRIASQLEPIEKHLADQEDAYEAEKERIKREAEEAKQRAVQARLDKLSAVGANINALVVGALGEPEFAELLAEKTAAWEFQKEQEARAAEEKRQQEAAEAEARRLEGERLAQERKALEERQRVENERIAAENERLAAERRKLDEQREAAEAESRRLEAERNRLAEEEAARVRAAEVERQKAEAAERSRLETEARLQREAEEKRQQEAAAEQERVRLEALRPDRDKLSAVADAVLALELPTVSSQAARARAQVQSLLRDCAESIRMVLNNELR